MNWRELQNDGVTVMGGAVSGGLDSCTIARWLTDKGFTVVGFTVDLGQPDARRRNKQIWERRWLNDVGQ